MLVKKAYSEKNWNTLLLSVRKGQIFMAQVKKTKQTQSQQGEMKSQKSPLGIYTELGHKTIENGFEEHLNKLGNVLKNNNKLGLRDKYTMAEVAHAIIRHYVNNYTDYLDYVRGTRVPLFKRNTFCGNILEEMSSVKMTMETGSVVNTHIAHCASVWLCPVCSSVIQSRRAKEIQQAIDWAKGISLVRNKETGEYDRVPNGNNYQVAMVTYTASHNVTMPLKSFGVQLQKAYRQLNKNIYRERKAYEIGNIKAVEFTHSYKNAWHKHFHVIYILKEDCNVEEFFAKIQKYWEHACIANGLLDATNDRAVADFRLHSVDLVQDATEISNYVNKSADEWTLADEMSKSVLKVGRSSEHRTPFQMLVDIATTTDSVKRYRDIDTFIEYMVYTAGLHQQDWSNGLKDAVGINDLSDDEIMEQQKETAIYIAGLTVAHWHLLRSKYQRIQYIKAVKEGGYQGLVDFFSKLDSENELPDLLTGDEARLYETYGNYDEHSQAEEERYQLMKTILVAIDESQPSTYKAKNKPCGKVEYTTEERASIKSSVTGVDIEEAIYYATLKDFDMDEYNKKQDAMFTELVRQGKTQLSLFT